MRLLLTFLLIIVMAVGSAIAGYAAWPVLAGQVSSITHGPDLTIGDKRYRQVTVTLAADEQYNRIKFEWDRPVAATSVIASPPVAFDRFDGGDAMDPATLWQPDLKRGKAGADHHFLLPLQDETGYPAMVSVLRQGATGPLSGQAGTDIPNEKAVLSAIGFGVGVFVLLLSIWLPAILSGATMRRKVKSLEKEIKQVREDLTAARSQVQDAGADARVQAQNAERESEFWRDAVRSFLTDRNHDQSDMARMLDNISVTLRGMVEKTEGRKEDARPVNPSGPLVARRD